MTRFVSWLRDRLTTCRHQAAVLDLQPGRVRLRCPDCGRVTAGWAVGGAAFTLTQPGDPARHRLAPVTARLVVSPGPIPVFPDIDALADYLAGGGSDAAVLMEEPTGPNRIQ